MTHYSTTLGEMPAETNLLLKQTFLIIDAKIKYIDDRVHQCYNDCTCLAATNNHSPNDSKNSLIKNLDKLLHYIESLQHELRCLQVLKVWLKEETARDIYDLLANNTYTQFTTERLESRLKQQAGYYAETHPF